MVIMHRFRDLEVASVRASAAQSVCFFVSAGTHMELPRGWKGLRDRGWARLGVRGENV